MADIREELLETRERLAEILRKELLGPGSEVSIPDEEHELISSSPEQRYSMGILFPREQHFNAENNESEATGNGEEGDSEPELEEENDTADTEQTEKGNASNPGDDEGLDEEVSLAAQNMPASMGISFVIDGDVSEIRCDISFATYRKALATDCRVPMENNVPEDFCIPEELEGWLWFDKEERSVRLVKGGLTPKVIRDLVERMDTDSYDLKSVLYKLCNQLSRGYVREPHLTAETISFKNSDYVDENKNLCDTELKLTALRRRLDENRYAVTIMLVNDATGKPSGTRCIFQPVITVTTDDRPYAFCEYAGLRDFNMLDDEEKSLELQYRNKKVYGTGLGVSVDWDIDEYGKGILRSCYIPVREVPTMSFELPARYEVDSKVLSMKYLSDLDNTDKAEKITLLRSFVSAYAKWIHELRERVSDLKEEYRETAEHNIAGCENACRRMTEGVDALESGDLKWQAFTLQTGRLCSGHISDYSKKRRISTPVITNMGSGLRISIITGLIRRLRTDILGDRSSWHSSC